MATNELKRRDEATFRQWKIIVKSNDGGRNIDFEEPFGGNLHDASKRANIMWARTSYQVNGGNLDTYMRLEVFDESRHEYRKVRDYRGTYPKNWPAPAATV